MLNKITKQQVHHVAKLANIPIDDSEAEKLATGFRETLETITDLQSVDVSGVEPTHQVTGMENILREDKVDDSRTFTQEQALANAKQTHQGFFVVPRLIKK
ncbi:MAG: Asp-tRNA(Asn)/Glu-tRNA(Gln) amidotransferase subunit GatC [Candidatus Pacebacteria bacterium]|nr:Asp-tRNA(Asn)/Glu-tRNA(Gln) amidotransferase subunit GatC [Candidatus Paceibacterota bacterium]